MIDWFSRAKAARVRPSDPARDFCQWPYTPRCDVGPGALRSEALLYAACAVAGFDARMAVLLDAVRDARGAFETVWGVKRAAHTISIELYFYDYDRTARRQGLADFKRSITPVLASAVPARDSLPFFMFSAEIGQETLQRGELSTVDLYLGNPGSTVSSGLCYGLDDHGTLDLRNAYFFFDACREQMAAWDKLTESVFVTPDCRHRERFFWPSMDGMETVVVANKRSADALYFSRITADQLLAFMARTHWPAALYSFLETHKEAFRHLLFDAGWDFRCDGEGRVIPTKASFYGLI